MADVPLRPAIGEPVPLTGKHYKVLELLSLRKGFVLTKEMFLDHVYGGVDEPDPKIIDVYVCKLRKKLARTAGGSRCIEPVWGRGYTLRDPAATPVVGKSAADLEHHPPQAFAR
jgi:two-component system cell cycle response regulator CtrA